MALAIANNRISRDAYLQGELVSETYILAETDSPVLTLHRRDGTGFRRESLSGPDAILDLPEAAITIPLAELYRDVN